MLGEGVNKLGSSGSRVMVGRKVGVRVGCGVSVMGGVPVGGVPVTVDSSVLNTNTSSVCVGSREKGVAVKAGGLVGVGVPRNGIETGRPLHPERRRIKIRTGLSFFIIPLRKG
jgi:hypothetical protein